MEHFNLIYYDFDYYFFIYFLYPSNQTYLTSEKILYIYLLVFSKLDYISYLISSTIYYRSIFNSLFLFIYRPMFIFIFFLFLLSFLFFLHCLIILLLQVLFVWIRLRVLCYIKHPIFIHYLKFIVFTFIYKRNNIYIIMY